jgi:hypothetical protein
MLSEDIERNNVRSREGKLSLLRWKEHGASLCG